jgi:ATP/maltotriose-dependent transcriptional regulator MalT
MKLHDAKLAIEKGDYSDSARQEFYVALRRSGNDFSRSQYCRLLANELSKKKTEGATLCSFKLLEHAMEQYPNAGASERCSCLQLMGNIWFSEGEYKKAYEFFCQWKEMSQAMYVGLRGQYMELLKSILLKDNFTFSEELSDIYPFALEELSLPMRFAKLYLLVAQMVLAKAKSDMTLVDTARMQAIEIVEKAAGPSALEEAYSKNKLKDTIDVPKALLNYIKCCNLI